MTIKGVYGWILASALLWIYVFVRAYTLSFTHDESLSYTIVLGDTMRGLTPNNHYLNTWLMSLLLRAFGPAEWSLRFGSLLAFGLYLSAGTALLLREKDGLLRGAGFILFFLHPFLLDFFGLARGYSWAMAGVMGMLWSLYQIAAGDVRDGQRFTRFAGAGLLSGAVGVLGNFALLNVLLPYLGLLALLLVHYRRTFNLRQSVIWLVYAGLYAGLFRFVLTESFRLKERGELYFGGKNGFVQDTINSLIDCSLYLKQYAENLPQFLSWGIVAVGVCLIGAALLGMLRTSVPNFAALSGSLLGLTVACVLAQHILLETPLPTDRMATYFIPLFSVALFAALQQIAQYASLLRIGIRVVAVAIGLPLLFHFVQTANTAHCFMWYYDKNTKTVMEQLPAIHNAHYAGRSVTMAAHALFEPASNYYRVSRRYDWLELIPKDGVRDRKTDIYYTKWDDFDNIPDHQHLPEIKSFEDTRSTCWRR